MRLEHELAVINYAVEICRSVAGRGSRAFSDLQRGSATWAEALRDALEGALDSVIGAFLCARLIRMAQDYADCTRKCMQLPQAEDPTKPVRDALQRQSAKRTRDPTDPIWTRHSVFLAQPLEPSDDSSEGKRKRRGRDDG